MVGMRARWLPGCLAAAGLALGLAGRPGRAEEEKPAADEKAEVRDGERAKRAEKMLKIAADYKLTRPAAPDAPLERLKEPALRWSNPLRKTDDGMVFLWTIDRRPAAALCVYTYGENGIDHEFQSLSGESLELEYRSTPCWHPERPGVEFVPLRGEVDPPAGTPAQRLTQMRKFLRDFSATVGHDAVGRHELRLLTQPLYRYSDPEQGLVDGAVFAFVQGTDPELLLLIEARGKPGEPATWQVAPARMTMVALELKYQGASVWSIDNWDQKLDTRAPYITFVRRLD